MKKLLLSIVIVLGLSFFTQEQLRSQTCPNLNFSAANFSYWQAYTGKWQTTVTINKSQPTANRHEIMNAQQLISTNRLNDEKCSAIPKVPSGFSYAAKLGNASVGAEMEALEYTMTIDSTNALLILHFAWVMEDPKHTPNDQPQFSMTIKDSLGNPMNFPCGNVNFVASQNLTNLACKTTSLVARNWTTVGFNLSPLMGQTIKAYFETRDCKQTAHYGYAYLVGECRPFAIDLIFCEGQANAVLTAPNGFIDYQWTRSSDANWKKSGKANQTITVTDPTESEVFTCQVISELNNCSATLTAAITKTYTNADFVMRSYDTCTRVATFVDSSSVINGKKASILWEIPALNAVSNDSIFTYPFPDPIANNPVDYLVRFTVITENGCEKTKEDTIRIYPSPEVKINGVSQLCMGDSTYLKAVALRSQFSAHQWSWIDENNATQTATGDSIKVYGQGIYRLVSTNTENCASRDTIDITTFPTPYIELTSKTMESCNTQNGSIVISAKNAALPVSFLWNTGATTAKIDTLNAGTYHVTITDGNGCHADTSIVVDYYPLPTHNVAKTHETCNKSNGTITISASSGNPSTLKYIWTGLTDTTSLLTGLKAGNYILTIQDTLCVIKDTITIENTDIPVANFATYSYDTCTRTAIFTDSSSVTNGIKNSILWEIPALNITSTDSVFIYTFPDPISNQSVNYSMRLVVLADHGCVDTAEQQITIYSSPEVKINGEDMMCVGDSIYLWASTVKSQIINYTWSWDDGNNVTQTAIGDSIKIYGSGIYILTATNTENCTATDIISVISAPVPHIEVTSNIWETCQNGNGYIEITHRNALEPVKYTWNTSNPQDTTNRLEMLEAGIYQVSMIDGNGCKTDTNITVDLYPMLTVGVVESPEICNNKNGSIVLAVNSAMPSTITYIWDGLPNNSPTLTGLKAGTYKVTVQDTLCSVDTTAVVETLDGLLTDFDIQFYDTCNRIVSFINRSTVENGKIKSVVWEIPQLNIKSADTVFTHTFDDPPTDQSENYMVMLTVTTEDGCVISAEHKFPITVYPSPKIAIDGDHILCTGDSIYLKAMPLKSKFVKYVWTWKDENNAIQTAIGDSLLVNKKGIYSLMSINTENCISSDSTIVTEAPLPEIKLVSSTQESCEKGNGSIQISSDNAVLPVKYTWNTGRKQDTTDRIDMLKAGTYSVKVTDGNGCSADKEVSVGSYNLPIVVNVDKTPERCYRSDGEISISVSSDAQSSISYRWEGYPDTTSSLTGLNAGTYKVIIQDSLCMIDTIISINHIDGPTADFEISSYSVIVNENFVLTDKSMGNINTWNWSMSDGNKLTGKVVTYRFAESGNHKILLEVIDENGCTDTTSKDINIFKLDVFIPNVFTPNGDGINDIWKPVMNEYSTEGYRLSVFDRWGQVVFHTIDTEEGWDGRINGNQAAPNTVYSYQLIVRDYLGTEYKFVGHVTLVR